MAKKKTKRQTSVHKTHRRKLKAEQHKPHQTPGRISFAPETK